MSGRPELEALIVSVLSAPSIVLFVVLVSFGGGGGGGSHVCDGGGSGDGERAPHLQIPWIFVPARKK